MPITIALPFRSTRVMNRHARINRRKDNQHADRSHHRNRRPRCGTERACRADEGLLEEGCQPQEERAQSQKGAKAAKPTAGKKPAKANKAVKPTTENEPKAPRAESKGAKILELIGRSKGATLAEIMKATDWQAHSLRGFLSTAGKKCGLKIASEKNEAGERVYQIMK